MTGATGGGPPLRVLMWPARSNRHGNPYNALLADAIERAGAEVAELTVRRLVGRRVDVVHVHWPEWALQRDTRRSTLRRGGALLAGLAVARRRGARVVWTVHNVRAHDRADTVLSRVAHRAFLRLVDGTIALSRSVATTVAERFPALPPPVVVPHGHYRDAYPPPPPQAEARDRLGLPARGPVIAFVGQIRPYKGVDDLLRAFAGIPDPDAVLLVAGRLVGRERGDLDALAAGDPRVQLRLGHVPPQDLPVLVAAADVVALPFRRVSSSGSALLALSLDRPVLVPATGPFPELADEVGDAWVRCFRPPLDTAAVDAALRPGVPAGRPDLERHEWPAVADATLAAYRAAGAGAAGHT